MKINKKGQQTIGIIVFLLLGIVSIFALYVTAVPLAESWERISDEFHKDSAFGDNSSAGNLTLKRVEQVDSLLKGDKNVFDQFILFGFVGIMLSLFVFALFFSDHPIFIVFLILGIIVVVLVSSQLVNFGADAVNSDELNDKADEFDLSGIVLGSQLPLIVLIMGAVITLIAISRRSGSIGA